MWWALFVMPSESDPLVKEGRQRHIVVVAGEASGDMHAARMVSALKKRYPDCIFSGMGSGQMRAAGVDIRVDSAALSVVGLIEVLAHLKEIRQAFKTIADHIAQSKPDLLILVDYVEFNLRLAKAAKQHGIKVLFYVSPQVWAWRQGRVKSIGRVVDAMAVLFPFEVDFYQQHGVPVRYVGNPLVDEVHVTATPTALRAEFGLNENMPVVGLFPGSRRSELSRHMPVMGKTVAWLHERLPNAQFIMALAPGVDASTQVLPHLPKGIQVRQISGRPYDVMHASTALMIASGTATLEAGLLAVPMAIFYKVSAFSHAIMKRFIRIPNIGLANIVAGRRVVQEFIQHKATPEFIGQELFKLLTDIDYQQQVRDQLAAVKTNLGHGGGSENVAQMAAELLEYGRLNH
jgi:lipid-A-disaccharide synthase